MFKKPVKPYFVLLLLIVIGFTSNTMAQKCSYEKNEIDALTELVVKRTAPSMITRINGQPLYAKAQSIGDNKYLKLVFYKYNDFSFKEEREVGFVLSNNEEILLYPRLVPVDSTKMDQLPDVKSLIIYKLTDDQYEKLAQTPVAKFKYYLTSGFVEVPIKSSKQGNVMQVLRCVK